MRLKNGLILAASLLLSACAASPKSVIIPDYTGEFISCVASEYESRIYGDCTERVVNDWSIIID